jgi:aspartate/methionine/tyrosine aminotransferase
MYLQDALGMCSLVPAQHAAAACLALGALDKPYHERLSREHQLRSDAVVILFVAEQVLLCRSWCV